MVVVEFYVARILHFCDDSYPQDLRQGGCTSEQGEYGILQVYNADVRRLDVCKSRVPPHHTPANWKRDNKRGYYSRAPSRRDLYLAHRKYNELIGVTSINLNPGIPESDAEYVYRLAELSFG